MARPDPRRRLRWGASRLSGLLGAWSLALSTASAQQQNIPRLGYVSPAGTRQGSTVVVIAGGQYLDGANRALLSGDGVEARFIEYFKPVQKGQANSVRDKLKRLLDKKAQASAAADLPAQTKGGKPAPPRPPKAQWTAEDEMLAAALKRKLAAVLRGPAVPATAESVLLQITVEPGATPGHRELRLETPKGWTNPLTFCVGTLPESSREPQEELLQDSKAKPKSSSDPILLPPLPPLPLSLPCVANGQIGPGGADRYQFEARKGQKLVIAAETRSLIPYISDAVPGWFQAALTLSDASGRELAYADHFRFDPEPVLLQEIPGDGRYTVEIRDALYRGREDFVYRLALGELPFIDTIFPLGGKAGAQTTLALSGWNLPSDTLVFDHREHGPGIYPISVSRQGAVSNLVPFAVDDLPEISEKEPNGDGKSAQSMDLPVIVNGRIAQPDEEDAFRFEGAAGQEIVAEVHARRLRSPLDSVLTLLDASGQTVARNDDHEDKGSGLETHHSDSYLRATLPAAGVYTLRLADVQHQGGPAYAYRLRISAPRPDFELRLAPSRILARAGASVPVTVFALRRDGFAGPIDFALRQASDGLTLSGGPLAPDQDQANLTVKVLYWTGQETAPRLQVEGRATVAGREVRRLAIPAEHMTQAFEYRHLVPAGDLKMSVTGKVAPRISIKLLGSTPVKIPLGKAVRVKFSISPPKYLDQAKVTANGKLPAGISLGPANPSGEEMEVELRCDDPKIKAGARGSVSLVATMAPEPPAPGKKAAPASPTRLPSIPYQVVNP